MSLVRELKTVHKVETRILVWQREMDHRLAESAILAGAKGYVSGANTQAELAEAMLAMVHNQLYVSRGIHMAWLEEKNARKGGVRSRRKIPMLDAFSEMERVVWDLLRQEMPTSKIAKHLTLSRKTVETHLDRMMKKLKCAGIRELRALAV